MSRDTVITPADQCGRDTPLADIGELLRTVQEFGCYPLNMEHIHEEIHHLEKVLHPLP